MDQQQTSHSLINTNFAQTAAANLQNQLGLNSNNGNVGNTQLLSRLHQLSSFNAAAASTLLPTNFGSHLTNDFYNPSSAAWQSKIAAMIPVYNSVLGDTQTQLESFMEQSLKAASGFNLGNPQQSNNLNNGVNIPIMAAVDFSRLTGGNSIPNLSNSIFPSNVNSSESQMPLNLHDNNGTSSNLMMSSTNQSYNQPSSSTLSLNTNDSSKINNSPFFTSPTGFSMSRNQSFNMNNQQPSTTDPINMSTILSIAQQRAKLNSPTKNINLSTNTNNGPNLISPTLSSLLPTSTAHNEDFEDLLDLNLFDPLMQSSSNDHQNYNINQEISQSNNLNMNNIHDTSMPSTSSNIQNQQEFNQQQQNTSKNNISNTSREIDNDKELDQWFPMDLLPDENPNSPEQGNLFGGETTGFSLDPIMFTPPDSPAPVETKSNAYEKRFIQPPQPNFPPQQNSEKPFLQPIQQHIQESMPSSSRIDPMMLKSPPKMIPSTSNKIDMLSSQPTIPKIKKPQPSASTLDMIDPIVFLPKTQRKVVNDRVPVYKRKSAKSSSGMTLEKALEKVSKPKVTDEFSFTDDEEEEPPPTKPIINFNSMSTDEIDEKVVHQKSPSVSNIPETSVVRRKQNVIEDKEQINKQEDKVKDKIVDPVINQLAKRIQERRDETNQLSSVFMYSEMITDNDNSFIPLSPPKISISKRILPLVTNNIDSSMPSTSKNNETHREQLTLRLKIEPKSPESNSNHTNQINNVQIKEEPSESRAIIPKLVIKIPKRESTTIPSPQPVHKKKKKKHKKYKDEEYLPSEERRKKKKKKNKEKDHDYHPSAESEPISTAKIIPTRRTEPLIESNTISNHVKEEANEKIMIEKRLSCFKQANGSLPKGTFVISKQDIFKADCPLWKVDNQNLLQKYPQFIEYSGGYKVIRYKNSSTYSGWCDQVATGYLVIQCKYLKHTRAESIVEPEIPITDLIPATSEVIKTTLESDSFGLDDEPAPDDIFEPVSTTLAVTKDTIRSHMRCFTQAMLKHAINMDFLQTVKTCNDWDYLYVLNEIDNMTDQGKQKINERVRWGQHFEVVLTLYPHISLSDYDSIEDGDICHACGDDYALQNVQVYANHSYDYDSMKSIDLPKLDGKHSHPSIEFALCSSCCRLAFLYHQLHHMKYNIFKLCEDLLENVSKLRPELSTDALIMMCINKRSWQRKLINDYAKLWRKIQDNNF